MPFTPIHMEPEVLLKSLLQGSFSLMVFGLKIVKISKKRSWVRHDEHYHVDFDILCKEHVRK